MICGQRVCFQAVDRGWRKARESGSRPALLRCNTGSHPIRAPLRAQSPRRREANLPTSGSKNRVEPRSPVPEQPGMRPTPHPRFNFRSSAAALRPKFGQNGQMPLRWAHSCMAALNFLHCTIPANRLYWVQQRARRELLLLVIGPDVSSSHVPAVFRQILLPCRDFVPKPAGSSSPGGLRFFVDGRFRTTPSARRPGR